LQVFDMQILQFTAVGMEGSAKNGCGRALLVVRNRPNAYFVLPLSHYDSDAIDYSSKDVAQWVSSDRATLFPKPVLVAAGTVAVYAKLSFLRHVGGAPRRFAGITLNWQECDVPSGRIAFVSLPFDVSTQLLDSWAENLFKRLETSLSEFFESHDPRCVSVAEDLAQSALTAAHDDTLRTEIYYRYGVALRNSSHPERLSGLYRALTRFNQNISSEMFDDRLSVVEQTLSHSL
jgi:hypothetical protein